MAHARLLLDLRENLAHSELATTFSEFTTTTFLELDRTYGGALSTILEYVRAQTGISTQQMAAISLGVIIAGVKAGSTPEMKATVNAYLHAITAELSPSQQRLAQLALTTADACEPLVRELMVIGKALSQPPSIGIRMLSIFAPSTAMQMHLASAVQKTNLEKATVQAITTVRQALQQQKAIAPIADLTF